MADDETSTDNSPTTDQTGSDTSGDQPNYATDHDADTQQPRPGSTDQPVTSEDIKAQTEAINTEKDRITQQRYRDAQDENNLQKELDDIKAEARAKPPQPPVPEQLPAPYTQQEKNGIAVAAMNILKWGTLIGLAYGLRGRSKNRNAIFKMGLGAALQGYAEGDNAMRNRAATMWEKNRKEIMDQNRDQQQTYNDIMRNQKLSLQQKIDVFREQSVLFQDARAHDAATRGDIGELQKMMDDKKRMQHDFEKQTRELSNQWLGWIGLGKKDGIDYRQWVRDQGGPDIAKAKNEDEAYQIETDYPRHKMLEQYAATKAQESLKQSTDKSAADETARLRAKYEEEKRQKEEDKTGGDNPLGLNLGE